MLEMGNENDEEENGGDEEERNIRKRVEWPRKARRKRAGGEEVPSIQTGGIQVKGYRL